MLVTILLLLMDDVLHDIIPRPSTVLLSTILRVMQDVVHQSSEQRYAWTLMVIYFLQISKKLPSLHATGIG